MATREPSEQIEEAALAIRRGDTVVFPTETVYGLGANAWDAVACARIYQIKRRPSFNPLIVHLAKADWLGEVASDVPPWAQRLADRFWPGPLTLVLPKAPRVPELVSSGLQTVAIRVPSHPVAHALLTAAGVPIAAPSANRFTRLSPTRVEDAREQLAGEVSIFLDGGPCAIGLESTIIGWRDERPLLLRPGGLTISAIESVVGPVERLGESTESPVLAPGMLRKHYSPRIPLWIEGTRNPPPSGKLGLLSLQISEQDRLRFAHCEELSAEGDLTQAAARLFVSLRTLEGAGIDGIVARFVPERELGIAINDRLRRAAQ